MPVYTDKRTGKKVIQYQIGYRYVPDKKNPGRLVKRPKYKTEVVGKSARVAKKILAQREAEWEKKKYQEEVGEPVQQVRYTFAELVEWYLNLPVTKQKKSYDKDVERSRYLLDYFGDQPAEKIKPSMVESFQYEIGRAKNRHGRIFKPATVNRMVALLKRIYNLAIREEMAQKNPCWKVTMLSEKNERKRILSAGEFKKLMQVLPKHLKPIVAVGYYSGMRLGEILGLTWEKVNMKEGYLELEPDDTKTSEPRRIYFNNELRMWFKEVGKIRRIDHNFVFTYKGKPLKRITRSFNNATLRAGIEDLRFHDLRHTFNTNMRKAGVDHTVIMKMTGHKTMAMFNRYNTVDQDDAIDAMERLDSHLGTVFSQKSSDIVQTAQKKGSAKTG